jgi:glycosyltransferase involved in cell wall biosynthesis
MRPPLVSVIMPVFNAGIFLRPAVESVLAQSCGDFELLLVDDGGNDGSDKFLQALSEPRVRVINHGAGRPNRGIAASRNLALAVARGHFIAFLNHDDVAQPDRFERQLEFFHRHPEIDLLGSAIDNIDGPGNLLNRQPFPTDHLGIRWMGLLDCPVRQSAMMARRASLTAHSLYYDESFVSNSDYEFIERMTRIVPSANLSEPLTSYRKHATNTSRLRYEMFVDAGNRIAHGAIRHELPDFPATPEDIANVRAVVLGYSPASTLRVLAATKRAWEVYLDLFDAFREKHRGNPTLASIQPRTPATS